MSRINQLPIERPTDGDFCPKEETNYEYIIIWDTDGLSLDLHIRPHEDHPEVIPDDPSDCDLHNKPTEPSTLEDLPAQFQHQFRDIIRILKNKYNLTEVEDTATCTLCYSKNGEEYILFSQHLTE